MGIQHTATIIASLGTVRMPDSSRLNLENRRRITARGHSTNHIYMIEPVSAIVRPSADLPTQGDGPSDPPPPHYTTTLRLHPLLLPAQHVCLFHHNYCNVMSALSYIASGFKSSIAMLRHIAPIRTRCRLISPIVCMNDLLRGLRTVSKDSYPSRLPALLLLRPSFSFLYAYKVIFASSCVTFQP